MGNLILVVISVALVMDIVGTDMEVDARYAATTTSTMTASSVSKNSYYNPHSAVLFAMLMVESSSAYDYYQENGE